ncbi:hypothetical protein OZX68_05875 [Streptococcaceae bacterium ESL0729]|nr:hypothetical protein OZX68_05875 [Streptococcaceae bacterium ESL0729]
MDKKQMIFKLKQQAHNQGTIEEIFAKNEDYQRAEIAHTKKIMYEDFIELLESWLELA